MMTLDEAIKHAEEVAEENETVANTRTFEDGYTVDEMYCDDTECINEHLDRCLACADEHRQLAEWLKELKHLREQPRWIPCNERLPENETRVLTTIKIPNRIARVRSGWYDSGFFPNDHSGFFHNDNGDVWKATDMEVVAWMPLPEPYKAESEG